MGYDNIIQKNYNDLNNLTALLRNYIEMYRMLISGAMELNGNSAIKKGNLIKVFVAPIYCIIDISSLRTRIPVATAVLIKKIETNISKRIIESNLFLKIN